MSDAKETQKKWAKLIAKAWADPEFKKLLETDPKAAYESVYDEMGFKDKKVITIPERPAGFKDDQLDNLSELIITESCSFTTCC